jgi:hypothetical protein
MPTAEWTTVSELMAGGAVEARTLMSDDPAAGLGGTALPVLLLECADPMMATDPDTGGLFELQTELLIRRGFDRFTLDAATPRPLTGWAVTPAPDGLELLDDGGSVWAYAETTPDPRWSTAAATTRQVLVLYGAWLGLRPPKAVRESQYGPSQRAAELRAGRSLRLVAAATVPFTRRS